MAVRRIRASKVSVTGAVVGPNGEFIDYESLLERDFIVLTQFHHPDAIISEQPVKLPYEMATGRLSHYTPDFLVRYGTGRTELVEVKPAEVLRDEKDKLAPKFAAAAEHAKSNGWHFVVRSEIDIRRPSLHNAHFLIHYRNTKPKLELCHRIMTGLINGPLPVNELISSVIQSEPERYQAIPQVWHLLSVGKLDADITVNLNQSSLVWLPR